MHHHHSTSTRPRGPALMSRVTPCPLKIQIYYRFQSVGGPYAPPKLRVLFIGRVLIWIKGSENFGCVTLKMPVIPVMVLDNLYNL